jgi:hypothetical protein
MGLTKPRDHLFQRRISLQLRRVAAVCLRALDVLPHLPKHNRVHGHQRLRSRSRVLHQHITDQASNRDAGSLTEILKSRQRVGHCITGNLRFEIGVPVVARPGIAIWFEVHNPYILCGK